MGGVLGLGWFARLVEHGVAYGKPLTRARETVAVVRALIDAGVALVDRGVHATARLLAAGVTAVGGRS